MSKPNVLSQSREQALLARDRQLSIATHELRTPITSILLNLQVLERSAVARGRLDAATVTRALEVPLRQLRRLMHMVDLLLDSAQVESERLALDLQPVDLQELATDVAQRLAALAAQAHCEVEVAPGPPVVGRWDRMRLEQVVQNLLTNAIKYGGGHARLQVWLEDGLAHLRIGDRGAGIAPEDRERVFAPFTRLPSAAGEDGAGLGLYIVREIVRAHGGRIALDAQPGGGALFDITLPP